MSEWEEVAVKEIASPGKHSMATGPFGSAISSKFFVEAGVPVIRGGNLSAHIGTKLSDNDLVFVSAEKAKEFSRSIVRNGDIVFTCWGTINQVGLIDDAAGYKEYVISNKQMKLSVDPTKADYKFIYYLFSGPEKQQEILNNGIGAAVPGFNLGQLKEMPLRLPPLPEQRAIAAVLSSLDDKIDLLHRQNKTLEALAETLFRQWFVEEASDDWEEGRITDLLQIVGGGTPKTSVAEYWNGAVPWLAGGDITIAHKSFVQETSKSISEIGLANSSAKLLPRYASVVSARGTVGKYCLLATPMAFSQSNYGILPTDNKSFFFTYLLLDFAIDQLKSAAYGSVFDTITTKTFEELEIHIASKQDIEGFESEVTALFEKMEANAFQIRTLEKLRDTLLPKLMSGEVRVHYE